MISRHDPVRSKARAGSLLWMLLSGLQCMPALADGPSDLRAALARLSGSAPVKGELEVLTLERHGEGRDAIELSGRVVLDVSQGPRGMQVNLGADTAARVDAETRAQGRDPDARTPTLQALKRLDTTTVTAMLSAAPAQAAAVDAASFKGERADTWRGRPARVLSYALPASSLDAVQRRYFRQYDGTLDIWIAADGTPLESSTRATLAGRAFIVGFDGRDDLDCSYGVEGDRLVATREETRGVRSAAGERVELRVVRTLVPD
jgi:hypothetical protein